MDRNRLPKKNRPSVGSVALRKESVDRNSLPAVGSRSTLGRSPQGERG